MSAAAGLAFPAAAADPALLARVLASSRVERRPRPPDASYLRDLAAGFLRALAELAASASQRLRLPQWLLVAAVAMLAGTALALLARAWWRRRRRRRGAAAGSGRDLAHDGGAGAATSGDRRAEDEAWDAAAWRLELERRLAQERIPEALRAAWWWLARSLAGTAAEPTWTGRELLRWSRRDDLGALLRQLDAMAYGPRQPGTAEVRRLAARLQEALS
jgi:hypothetical protein